MGDLVLSFGFRCRQSRLLRHTQNTCTHQRTIFFKEKVTIEEVLWKALLYTEHWQHPGLSQTCSFSFHLFCSPSRRVWWCTLYRQHRGPQALRDSVGKRQSLDLNLFNLFLFFLVLGLEPRGTLLSPKPGSDDPIFWLPAKHSFSFTCCLPDQSEISRKLALASTLKHSFTHVGVWRELSEYENLSLFLGDPWS